MQYWGFLEGARDFKTCSAAKEHTNEVQSGGRDLGVIGHGAALGQSRARSKSFVCLFCFPVYKYVDTSQIPAQLPCRRGRHKKYFSCKSMSESSNCLQRRQGSRPVLLLHVLFVCNCCLCAIHVLMASVSAYACDVYALHVLMDTLASLSEASVKFLPCKKGGVPSGARRCRQGIMRVSKSARFYFIMWLCMCVCRTCTYVGLMLNAKTR